MFRDESLTTRGFVYTEPPLTTRQRVAREARKLAEECEQGIAPPMIEYHRYNDKGEHCALGWLDARAGIDVYDGTYGGFGDPAWGAAWEVASANNSYTAATHRARQAALVGPLRKLAEALEMYDNGRSNA